MNDLISRQMLLEYIHGEPVGRLLCDKYNLDGLIEQLPPIQPDNNSEMPNSSDVISRQAAIDALRTCYDTETITMDNGDEYINYGDAVGEIEQLPPIQPDNNSEMPNSSDVISRQAAIDALRTCYDTETITMDNGDEYINYGDAVGEIEQLPPIQPDNNSEMPNSSDVISRQAAIDAIDVLCQEHRYKIPGKAETYSQYNEAWQDALDRAEGAIGNLPPAEPKGRWIKLDMHRGMADHKCSVCEQECYVPTCMGEPMYAFCPNCGAKIEVTNGN